MDQVTAKVQELFGKSVTIIHKGYVGGGSINRTSVVTLSNETKLFLKENSGAMKGMFRTEASGLEALGQGEGPRVPKPLAWYEDSREQFLLMEYLPAGPKRKNYDREFGEQFARMHKSNKSDTWGFHEDNYIGSTKQVNTPCKSWIGFFGENRLGYQTSLAQRAGLIDNGLGKDLAKLISQLPVYLPEPEGGPTLIHGDLWSGNATVGPKGEPVILDPAVYYGHREADLAMTELFGRFQPRFYDAYDATWPLEPGYTSRKDLYNLYHMLNHLNLFGGGYLGSVRSIVNQYL